MSGGKHIRAIGDEAAHEAHDETVGGTEPMPDLETASETDASLADAVVGYEEDELNLEEYEEMTSPDRP